MLCSNFSGMLILLVFKTERWDPRRCKQLTRTQRNNLYRINSRSTNNEVDRGNFAWRLFSHRHAL